MVVNLLDKHFSDMELSLPAPGSTTTLDRISVCDVLALKGIGMELTRTRELLTGARARRTAGALSAETTEDSTPDAPPEIEGSPPEFPAFLEEKVYGQISQLP
jgi:hypothetical protein